MVIGLLNSNLLIKLKMAKIKNTKDLDRFGDADETESELDQLIQKNKVNKEVAMRKGIIVLYVIATIIWIPLFILYFYISYRDIATDKGELEESLVEVSSTVEEIGKEVGSINENTNLVEFNSSLSEIQGICSNLPYEVPTRQFKYASQIRSESMDLLKSCNNLVGMMILISNSDIENRASSMNLTASEISSLSESVDTIKGNVNSLGEINISILEELLKGTQLILFMTSIIVLIVEFRRRLKRESS